MRRTGVWVAVFLGLGVGCSESDPKPAAAVDWLPIGGDGPVDPIGRTDHDNDLPRTEVSATADLALDEAAITVAYDTTGAHVTIPFTVDRLTGAGTLDVAITDLVGVDGPVGTASLDFGAGARSVTVHIPATAVLTDQLEAAQKLVRYRVKRESELLLSGRVSLWQCLPHHVVQLWTPERLYSGLESLARVWVRGAETGTLSAATDVVVDIGGQKLTVTTDDAGQASFTIPAQTVGGSFTVTATAVVAGVPATVSKPLTVVPPGAPRVYVSTDKPLYRPGQTMHVRVLALGEADLKPVPPTNSTIDVYDGKGTKVFHDESKTDAFGVAALEAPLAAQVNVGTYRVVATVGVVSTERAVEVSEQALPKFNVDVALAQAAFQGGAKVTGTITARYFFGKAVVDADVTVTPTTPGLGTWTGKTNAEGVVEFELPAITHDAPLSVKVTDSAGFVVEKQATALYDDGQLQVTATPETATVPYDTPWRLIVETRTTRGAPRAATCRVNNGPAFDIGESGVGVTSISGYGGDIACTATIGGASGQGYVGVGVAASGDQTAIVRTDKAIYRPGDTVHVTVLASGTEPVTVDCVHRARIVDSRVLDLDVGKAEADFKVGAGEEGTVRFAATVRDGDRVIAVEKTVYVQRAPATVTITPGKDSYLPGTDATLDVTVTNAAGEGQAAAVGLAIADESVFALAGSVGPSDVASYFLGADAPEGARPYVLTTELSESQQLAVEAKLGQQGTGQSVSWAGATLATLRYDARSAAQTRFYTLASETQAALQDVASQGAFKNRDAKAIIERLTLTDFWGQRITMQASVSDYGYALYANVQLTSAGLDEIFGNDDDLSGWLNLSYGDSQSGVDGTDGWASADSASAGSDGSGGFGWPEDDVTEPGPGGEEPPPAAAKPRQDFPETLFVDPRVITDGTGKATLTIPLADSITRWRVQAIANTQSGLVGGTNGNITVFQDFFVDVDLPRQATQDDRLTLPVGVFNFTDAPIIVDVSVTPEPWFELVGAATKVDVEVPAGKATSVPFEIVLKAPGLQSFEVAASAPGFSDAAVRTVKVIPNGQRYDESASGKLEGGATVPLSFPGGIVPAGNAAVLKLMGSSGSQLLDGLDGLLQTPTGCFEPMMNTTWTNALVLDYLNLVSENKPELAAQATANLVSGLQQTATFECDGGGFTWYGNPDPPHVILTAFALIMFDDIGKYAPVDEPMVTRARDLLEGLQKDDGSFQTLEGTKNELLPWDELRTTCIVAWGLAANGTSPGPLASALGYIKENLQLSGGAGGMEADSYTLAMCLNALLEAEPTGPYNDTILGELTGRATVTGSGADSEASWTSDYPGITAVFGDAVPVETTALVAQALFHLQTPHPLGNAALTFLARHKTADGNFVSTQGTIQSLRAFVASAAFNAKETDVNLTVKVGGNVITSQHIDMTNRDVVHYVDLGPAAATAGDFPVTVEWTGKGTVYYQLASTYYVPWTPGSRRRGPMLDVTADYAPQTVAAGQLVTQTVSVTSSGQGLGAGDMPMIQIPIPAGFDADLSAMDAVVKSDPNVARYVAAADHILVYLHAVPAGITNVFHVALPLRPRFPMTITTPVAKTWPFYRPEATTESEPVTLTVTP